MPRPPITDDHTQDQGWYDPKTLSWGRTGGPAFVNVFWSAWYDDDGQFVRMVDSTDGRLYRMVDSTGSLQMEKSDA